MFKLKKISLILLSLFLTSHLLNASIIYFANINKKQCGFIAKSGEDYYAYTSQIALLSLGRFAIKTTNGADIKKIGSLEIS
jgi:hypothetical protein